jgi:serine/threonine protein phosphatase PrpC
MGKKVNIRRSCHTIQGTREEQEDRISIESPLDISEKLHFFCVFDGHGGKQAAEFCKENLIRIFKKTLQENKRYKMKEVLCESIRILNHDWDNMSLGVDMRRSITNEQTRSEFFTRLDKEAFAHRGGDSGTTLCCVVYDESVNVIYIANLGDSRCIVYDGSSSIIETKDHTVTDFCPENTNFSFTVKDGRIEDDLAMSKSIGDNTPRLLGVIGRNPDIIEKKLSTEKCCIILATDGLFDVVSSQELFAQEYESAKKYIEALGEENFIDNTSMIHIVLSRT